MVGSDKQVKKGEKKMEKRLLSIKESWKQTEDPAWIAEKAKRERQREEEEEEVSAFEAELLEAGII